MPYIVCQYQVDEVAAAAGSKEFELPRLSQQLLLDSLWNTLSECLQVRFPCLGPTFLINAVNKTHNPIKQLERTRKGRNWFTKFRKLEYSKEHLKGPI